MMGKTRIAALGSYTEGDNVAWLMCEELSNVLRSHGSNETQFDMVQCRQPTDLLQDLDAYDQLILLDAFIPGENDPDWIRFQIPEDQYQLKSSANAHSTHGIDITSVISLAESIGSLPASVVIYGINSQKEIAPLLIEQLAVAIGKDLKQSLCV